MIDRRTLSAGLAALAAGCARQSAGLDRLSAGEQGRVASVRSGEVLTLESSLEVRLASIEAPNGSEPMADAARAALATKALGKPVTLLYGGLARPL